MSHFPVHTLDSAPDQSKDLMQLTAKNFGFVPNLISVMATSPSLTEAYLSVAGIFANSSLTPTEQQVVLLTVSYYHQCTYCVAAHTAIAGMKNVDPEIVTAIRQNKPLSDSKLQALREFTNLLLDNRGWANDEDIQNFLNAGYQAQHLLDILVGIAQKTLSNFTNHLAKTPLDNEFEEVAWSPVS